MFKKKLSAFIWIILVSFTGLSEATDKVDQKVDIRVNQEVFQIHLGIENESLVRTYLRTQTIQLEAFFEDKDIIYNDMHIVNNQEIVFEILDPKDENKVKEVFKTIYKDIVILTNNGLKYSFKLSNSGLLNIITFAIIDAVEIINNRLAQFGLSEYSVRKKEEKIEINISGLNTVKEKQRILKLISRQGMLQIVKVGEEDIPIILASKVDYAKVSFDADNNPIVKFTLRESDSKRLANYKYKNIGKQIAVVLDNKVYSTSVIDGRVDTRNGQITSKYFTVQNAFDLAIVLRSGAILGSLHVIKESRFNKVAEVGISACESKSFTNLQLLAATAFASGDMKKSLKLFQEASKICPTDEDIKSIVEDLKKGM